MLTRGFCFGGLVVGDFGIGMYLPSAWLLFCLVGYGWLTVVWWYSSVDWLVLPVFIFSLFCPYKKETERGGKEYGWYLLYENGVLTTR